MGITLPQTNPPPRSSMPDASRSDKLLDLRTGRDRPAIGGGDQAKSLRNRLTRMKERRATTKESRRQLTPPEKTAGDSGRNRVG